MAFPPSTKILIVDDMLTMRKLVLSNLHELGYSDVVEALDGLDAWKKLTESTEQFGLIISDWNMPIMSGLEFLEKCKSDDKYKAIPFVMLTAEAEQFQVLEAVKKGVSNYIIKPFSPNTIKEKLLQAYKKHNR
mgnify:CR=1 FL=1